MKKRFMLVAVLLGSLALASCVDDKESDSVTALRNAAVEKIKASSALTNTQNAYQQVLIALKEIEKEKNLAELERLKAEYANLIAGYESQMISSINTAVTNASTNYNNAVGALATAQGKLLDAQIALAATDISYEVAFTKYQQAVASQYDIIDANTAVIERLNAIDEAALDTDELKQQMNELAQQAYVLAETTIPQAKLDAEAAKEDVAEAYAKLAPTPADANGGTAMTAHEEAVYEENLLDYVAAAQVLQNLANDVNASPLVTSADFFKTATFDAEIDDCPITLPSGNLYEPKVGSEFAQATLNVTTYLNDAIKSAKNILGEKKTDTAPATLLYLALETAEADLKTKQDALTAAKAATPVNPATVAAAETDVANANIALLKAQEDVAAAEKKVTEAEENLAEFNAALAVVKEGSDTQKAYVAAVEALEALMHTQMTADHKVHTLEAELEELVGTTTPTWNTTTDMLPTPTTFTPTSMYGALDAIVTGVANVQELILQCEVYIANAKKVIEVGTTAEPKPNAETMKATLQAAADAAAEEVALQEKIVAKLKAVLEQLLDEA